MLHCTVLQSYFHDLHEESKEVLEVEKRVRMRRGYLAVYCQLLIGLHGRGAVNSTDTQGFASSTVKLRWDVVKEFLVVFCGFRDWSMLDSKLNERMHNRFRGDLFNMIMAMHIKQQHDTDASELGYVIV